MVEKRKPKIFGFKDVMERGIRKCLTFVIPQISSKIFGKIMYYDSRPCYFEKTKVPLG